MIDVEALRRDLGDFASTDFIDRVVALSVAGVDARRHGDLPAWTDAIEALPHTDPAELQIVDGAVAVPAVLDEQQELILRTQLLKLAPWRKGPFRIGRLLIDTEWRSDLKWERICSSIAALKDRRILDVGCGNGYYALRMAEQKAKLVIGVDPTLLFIAQFAALRRFRQPLPVHILPLRLQELPSDCPAFDTTVSMGVLYHQRDPALHLQQLQATLRPGGELLLETLILPGEGDELVVPESRYARMRNVWHLPSRARLLQWIAAAGYVNARVIDETVTTVVEQRRTEWMSFESLADALDPANPALTIEGLPAPRRISVLCHRP